MKTSLFLFTVSLVLFSACNANQQAQQNTNITTTTNQTKTSANSPASENKPVVKPAETVKLTAASAELSAGGAGEAQLKINITPPFHVNSNPPSEKNFIPLEVNFEKADGITVGKPVYPKGEMKTFAFSPDKPLSVYEGAIEVSVPLKADKSVAKGEKTLKGKLGFQPCDDEVCFPPQKIDIALTVNVN